MRSILKFSCRAQTAGNHEENTNVPRHIAGHCKRQLTDQEKQELVEVIKTYHRGLVPLIVLLC